VRIDRSAIPGATKLCPQPFNPFAARCNHKGFASQAGRVLDRLPVLFAVAQPLRALVLATDRCATGVCGARSHKSKQRTFEWLARLLSTQLSRAGHDRAADSITPILLIADKPAAARALAALVHTIPKMVDYIDQIAARLNAGTTSHGLRAV